MSIKRTCFAALMLLCLAGCGSPGEEASGTVTAMDAESLPFESLTQAVTYGDYAAVVRVAGDDRSAAVSAGDMRVTNRRLSLEVVDVLWDAGRIAAPEAVVITYGGWVGADGEQERRMVGEANSTWPEIGDEYVGVFVHFDGEPGLLNSAAFFRVDDDGVLVAAEHHHRADLLAGSTPRDVATILASTPPVEGADELSHLGAVEKYQRLEVERPPKSSVPESIPPQTDRDE